MSMQIRINKYLSDVGYCSRRQADKLVSEGRITINDRVALMGDKVSSEDRVCVDGSMLTSLKEKKHVLVFYKPRGIVCTTAEKENGKKIQNVIDYINYPERVYPIGRLDKESEGLLLLTDYGELADRIMKSRNHHEKEYVVKLHKHTRDDDIKRLSQGIHIVDDEKKIDAYTRKCTVTRIDDCTFDIILTQGINRQIRRMCKALGYRVLSLKRVRIMDIRLERMKPGEYRELSEKEIESLEFQTGLAKTQTKEKREERHE